jgi:hypothetical protein
MRKKLAVGLALALLAILVTALATWWIAPAEPPLRVGMAEDEAESIVGCSKYLPPNGEVMSVWVSQQ